MDLPVRLIRIAGGTIRSQMASARVGSPMMSNHFATGIWVEMMVAAWSYRSSMSVSLQVTSDLHNLPAGLVSGYPRRGDPLVAMLPRTEVGPAHRAGEYADDRTPATGRRRPFHRRKPSSILPLQSCRVNDPILFICPEKEYLPKLGSQAIPNSSRTDRSPKFIDNYQCCANMLVVLYDSF